MDRVELLRRGVALEGVTVGYNALEGIVAIAAGLAAGSVVGGACRCVGDAAPDRA